LREPFWVAGGMVLRAKRTPVHMEPFGEGTAGLKHLFERLVERREGLLWLAVRK